MSDIVEPEVSETEPVEEVVESEAPEEEAPVGEALEEEAPVGEALEEEAPVGEAPVDEAPVEEAPVEEAPVEEAPVEEAPVDEAPVESETVPVERVASDIREILSTSVEGGSELTSDEINQKIADLAYQKELFLKLITGELSRESVRTLWNTRSVQVDDTCNYSEVLDSLDDLPSIVGECYCVSLTTDFLRNSMTISEKIERLEQLQGVLSVGLCRTGRYLLSL
jgi:hypothetical protein